MIELELPARAVRFVARLLLVATAVVCLTAFGYWYLGLI